MYGRVVIVGSYEVGEEPLSGLRWWGIWGEGFVVIRTGVRSVAEYFHRDPVAVSREIGRVEERIRLDKGFKLKLRRLEEEVIRGHKRKISN